MISVILGIPIGIVCSLIAWWIIFHWYIPKIEFTNFVSKIKSSSNPDFPFNYRVRIKNSGKRSIIDITVRISITITGFYPNRKENISNFYLDLKGENKPILSKGNHLIFSLKYSALSSTLQKYVKDKHSYIEEILKIPDSSIKIFVFGTDELSGARKLFMSQKFYAADIRSDYFMRGGKHLTKEMANLEFSESV